jgi:crotonobetainyl-CoA:carnitine CoA-transferase CaiB-like acyl-CoA transferase
VTESLPRHQYQPGANLPLRGVRVVDISRLVAGNMVTHVLADFGAEVIKVEHPLRGDDLRNWRVEGVPTYWKVYTRDQQDRMAPCAVLTSSAKIGRPSSER